MSTAGCSLRVMVAVAALLSRGAFDAAAQVDVPGGQRTLHRPTCAEIVPVEVKPYLTSDYEYHVGLNSSARVGYSWLATAGGQWISHVKAADLDSDQVYDVATTGWYLTDPIDLCLFWQGCNCTQLLTETTFAEYMQVMGVADDGSLLFWAGLNPWGLKIVARWNPGLIEIIGTPGSGTCHAYPIRHEDLYNCRVARDGAYVYDAWFAGAECSCDARLRAFFMSGQSCPVAAMSEFGWSCPELTASPCGSYHFNFDGDTDHFYPARHAAYLSYVAFMCPNGAGGSECILQSGADARCLGRTGDGAPGIDGQYFGLMAYPTLDIGKLGIGGSLDAVFGALLTGGTYGYGLFRAHYAAPGSGAVTVRPLLLSESPSNAYEWSEIGQLAAGERVVMFASNTGGMHKALKVIDDGGFVQTIVEANDPSVQIPGYPGYVFYDIYDADINTEGEVAFWARITKPSSPAYVGVFVTQFCGGGCADWKRGDANCDGTVSMGDINPFVLAVSNRAAWEAQYTCPYECANDINRDGVVDSGDINPFVQCISGQCPD